MFNAIEMFPDRLAPVQRGGVAGYLIAAGLVVGAVMLRFAIAPAASGFPYLTFFPAITLAALFCGAGPGVSALIVSSLLASYLFVPPFNTLSLAFNPEVIGATVVFFVAGITVIGLVEAMYRQRGNHVSSAILLEQIEAARQELQICAAAFDSQEGIVITDPQGVILRVNQAFSEITGYAAEEIVGQTTRLLKSGRHDAAFYTAMWDSLRENGVWQGEIFDRRKNGEIYPKWMTITAVKDRGGVTTHYVSTQTDITERKAAEERFRHLAHHDPLTNLPNRFNLQERLDQALGLAERNHRQLALLLIDLDNFKTINDTLGHQTGDRLLVEVARRLVAAVRQSDLVARLGGDEFIIVLPDTDSPRDVAQVADKILVTVTEPYLIDGQELRTSPSIGICLFPDDATECQELIKKADVAMYQAKFHGKCNYRFFTEEMQIAAVQRLTIEADLRIALTRRQFVLHYQPQLDLRNGRLVGVEALVRWQHPERGLVSPLEFIPIAEETGLILPLGDWVLEEACRQLAQWRAGGITHIRMSVNLSASQFADPNLPLRITEILTREGLPVGSLDLEMTESMAMRSPVDKVAIMKVLTGQGQSLSIDDFGTGYSSLAYLKLFPISTLKIDRSFVKDIETDPNDADICDVTVLLAHKLGLEVVAEGVETMAQLKYLLSIGCEKIQGFLISRPLPGDQTEKFIRDNPTMTGLGTVDLWPGCAEDVAEDAAEDTADEPAVRSNG